jgi:hypothetical protein
MASIANSEDNSARAHVESSGDVGHGGGKSSANNPLLKGDLVKLIFSYTPASSICSLRLVNKTWRAIAAVCNFHWATLMCKTFCPVKSLLTSFKSGSFFPTYYDKSFESLTFREQVLFLEKVFLSNTGKHGASNCMMWKKDRFQREFMCRCRTQFEFIENVVRPAVHSPWSNGDACGPDVCIAEDSVLALTKGGDEGIDSAFVHRCLARSLEKLMAEERTKREIASLHYYKKAYNYNFLAFANLMNSVQVYASKLFSKIASSPSRGADVDYECMLSLIVPFRWEKYCSEGMLLNHEYRNFVIRKDFDTVTARVQARLAAKKQESGLRHPAYVIDDICDVLFRDGSTPFKPAETYYEASNSFLDVILMKGDCIPITLSLVLVIVCRRLGIRNLRPVGMPGHFIAGYIMPPVQNGGDNDDVCDGEFIRLPRGQRDAPQGSVEARHGEVKVTNETFFVDSFSGGRILTREDCYGIMNNRIFRRPMGTIFLDAYLEPTGALTVMQRIINNVLNIEVDRYQQFFSLYGLLTLQLMISRVAQLGDAFTTTVAISRIHVIAWILSPHPHMEDHTFQFNSKVAGLKIFENATDTSRHRTSLLDIVRADSGLFNLHANRCYWLRSDSGSCHHGDDDALFYSLTECKPGEPVAENSTYYEKVAAHDPLPKLAVQLTKPSRKITPEEMY